MRGFGLVVIAISLFASAARADDVTATSGRTIAAPLKKVSPRVAESWQGFADDGDRTTRVSERGFESVSVVDAAGATFTMSLRSLDDPSRSQTTYATCSATLPNEAGETPSARFARAHDVAAGACDRLAEGFSTPPFVHTGGYAGHIVLADGLALLSLGTLAPFAGPVVHLVHHQPKRALASFALRVGSIGLTAVLALGISVLLPPANNVATGVLCQRGDQCGPSGNYVPQMMMSLPIGAAIGWLIASAVDAGFLARPGYAYIPARDVASR